ncbi:ABC transporter permease [Romboutsia sp.]|uniref:ABC transporter permease n=1 Tax=Romboutsia sp. TaxID=1965302 RepID=UPI003F3A592C
MRINAIIIRIIRQFFRDKRTLALLIIAPLLVLTLVDYVFTEKDTILEIGVENESVKTILNSIEEDNNISIIAEDEAKDKFKDKSLDVYIEKDNNNLKVLLNGSDSSINGQVIKSIQQAVKDNTKEEMDKIQKSSELLNQSTQPTKQQVLVPQVVTPNIKIDNYYGNDDMKTIDFIGPLLIGIFIFFFVFLTSGVSFLRERTTGTLERLLATPIKRYEIVLGYLMGFGIFTIFQSAIISTFSIYVLDIYDVGSTWLLLLVTIVIALCALSLGMFLSSFANNEFQIIQFIPLVIVPQVFFSGLFPIRGMVEPLQWLAKCMPLTYAGEALRDVMIRGASFMEIMPDLSILLLFTLIFALLNIVALKKHRIW